MSTSAPTLRYSTAAQPRMTLEGCWRDVAEAIDAGAYTAPGLADQLQRPDESRSVAKKRIKSICAIMCVQGLLYYGKGEYGLTTKGREQLNAAPGLRHVSGPLADAMKSLSPAATTPSGPTATGAEEHPAPVASFSMEA